MISSRYCLTPLSSALLWCGFILWLVVTQRWRDNSRQLPPGILQLHEEVASFADRTDSHWAGLGPVPIHHWTVWQSQEDTAFWLTVSGHVLPLRWGLDWEERRGDFPKEIWGAIIKRRVVNAMQERQRVAHRAHLSEVCSGGNRCTDCHTHSPSKFGEENSGMRVLESPLQIIKTGGVQEWFCFCFVFHFQIKNSAKCQ